MGFVFLDNSLIGQMPDAVGLMVFGFLMIGTSFILRRIIGEDAVTKREEAVTEEAN